MPTATNMRELREMLLKELANVMNDASAAAKKDLKNATDYFYDGGQPTMYKRTGTLEKVQEVSKVIRTQDGVAVDVYFNEDASYLSGSKPMVGEVLLLADQGIPFTTKNGFDARPTVGRKGFWEKAKKDMENSLRKEMKKRFK